MKQRLSFFFLLLFVFAIQRAHAITYTWVGTGSNNSWSTTSNWQPSGVPSSGDQVIIGEAVCSPVLDQNRTIAQLTFNRQLLDLNGFRLTITGGGSSLLTSGLIKNGEFVLNPTASIKQAMRITSSNAEAFVLYMAGIGTSFAYTASGPAYGGQTFTGGTAGSAEVFSTGSAESIVLTFTDPQDNSQQKQLTIYTNAQGQVSDVQDDGNSVLGTYASLCGNVLSLGTGLFTHCSLAQDNQNYVRTRTVLIEGITTLSQVAALKASEQLVETEYVDGLGRTAQKVSRQFSPLGKDLVEFHEYDLAGRELKSYLPYIDAQCSGGYVAAAKTNQKNFFTTNTDPLIPHVVLPSAYNGTQNNTYTENVLDNSPLNRILEQAAPGDPWKLSAGKTMKRVYRTNDFTGVLLWTYDHETESATAVSDGEPVYYPAWKLMVTETTDENGDVSILFSDKQGRLILKQRKLATDSYASTYYIYDDFGRPVYILPPQAVSLLSAENWSISRTGAFTKQWLFSYSYDYRHNLSIKQVPGAEPVQLVRNRLNKAVMLQDGNQKLNNEWSVIKYDAFGRPVQTGIYADSRAASTIQTDFNAATLVYEKKGSGVSGYTRNVYPTAWVDSDLKMVYYYDGYDFDNNGTADYAYANAGLNASEPIPFYRNAGVPTGSKVKNLEASTWLTTVNFYDKKYQPVQSQSNNQLYTLANPSDQTSLNDITTVVYDFSGLVLKTKKVHTPGISAVVTVNNRYEYDRLGRLKKAWQQVNTDAEVLTSQQRYNELGAPIEINLHSENQGGSFLQSVDYRYNIRGWLTSINNSLLSNDGGTTNNDANDLFGMNFSYEAQETGLGNAPRYNGDISAIQWNTNNSSLPSTGQKAYSYSYDKLGRLTDALYAEKTTAWTSSAKYKEGSISYDLNGNIKTLKRSDASGNALDDLTYSYSGNKLSRVLEAGNTTGGFAGTNASGVHYTYDANGNLLQDVNKQFTFTYNYQDLITSATKSTGTITYSYDASGTRLKKVAGNGTNNITTYYVDGFVYDNSDGTLKLIYFQTMEGRVVNNPSGFSYEYDLKDHLGNARITFEKDASTGQAKVIQEDHYYAFGMKMGGLSYTFGGVNKFLYNGKEFQEELGLNYYDFGFRQYDAALGRWHSIDAMADNGAHLSPYQYVMNNPLNVVDPFGMEGEDVNPSPGSDNPDEQARALGLPPNAPDGALEIGKDGAYLKVEGQWVPAVLTIDAVTVVGHRQKEESTGVQLVNAIINILEAGDNWAYGEGGQRFGGVIADITGARTWGNIYNKFNGDGKDIISGEDVSNNQLALEAGLTFLPIKGVKASGVVKEGVKDAGTTVFRAVDATEKTILKNTGKFTLQEGGVEVKYFAKSIEDAHWYGQRLYPNGYSIVKGTVQAPINAAEHWFPHVDIGAYAFPKEALNHIVPH